MYPVSQVNGTHLYIREDSNNNKNGDDEKRNSELYTIIRNILHQIHTCQVEMVLQDVVGFLH